MFTDFGFGGWDQQQQRNTTQLYDILGVQKTATYQQIRKAYRKRAIGYYYPEKGGDREYYRKITEAYDILSNPEKKQIYNNLGYQGVINNTRNTDQLFQPFSYFQHNYQNEIKKSKTKIVTINITIKEIFNGGVKQIPINRYIICKNCNVKREKNVKQCMKWKGKGNIPKIVNLKFEKFNKAQQKCQQCERNVTFIKQKDNCQQCKGQKVLLLQQIFKVKIQPGCPNKHQSIFVGQSDQQPNIAVGDLKIQMIIQKDQIYTRNGADLTIIKQISVLQALTGVIFELDHLDGKKYLIATNPDEIISNKQIKTIMNLGLPFYKNHTSHGNLYIQFHINFPLKNQLSNEAVAQIRNCLGEYKIKSQKKQNIKIMQDFNKQFLNSNPSGGKKEDQTSSNIKAETYF